MEIYSLNNLQKLIQAKYSTTDECEFPDERLFTSILWNQLYSSSPTDILLCEQMISRLSVIYKLDVEQLAGIFHSIAYNSYEEKEYLFSAYCFRQACKMKESVSYRNNLAFVLRRHHQMEDVTKMEIIDLLLPGIKEKESFSIVNMSLFLSEVLATENDWQTADSLMKLLDEENFEIEQWWSNMASKNEAEGYLVIMWLLRHGKIEHSGIGTFETIIRKVENLYPQAPKWLFNKVKNDTYYEFD